jgi:hypothetical protein
VALGPAAAAWPAREVHADSCQSDLSPKPRLLLLLLLRFQSVGGPAPGGEVRVIASESRDAEPATESDV